MFRTFDMGSPERTASGINCTLLYLTTTAADHYDDDE
jgi:hypothetical protein